MPSRARFVKLLRGPQVGHPDSQVMEHLARSSFQVPIPLAARMASVSVTSPSTPCRTTTGSGKLVSAGTDEGVLAPIVTAKPDREHRRTYQGDCDQYSDGSPCQRALVRKKKPNPECQAENCEAGMHEESRRTYPLALRKTRMTQPLKEQAGAAKRSRHPRNKCRPLQLLLLLG